jgi:hypothetical protein
MRRRTFLWAVAVLGAAAAVAWRLRLLGRRPTTPPVAEAPAPSALIGPDHQAVFFAVADVIVPRWGEHPAASETDLLPRLEKLGRLYPSRAETLRDNWPAFEQILRQRVPFHDGLPDAVALTALFEIWYAEYRSGAEPGPVREYFELLRMDVLRVYYSSPAGWASVGYTGPVYRTYPLEAHAP